MSLTYHQRRYRDDPEFRLRKINYNRQRLGLPTVEHLGAIGVDLIAHARQRARCEKGRFA